MPLPILNRVAVKEEKNKGKTKEMSVEIPVKTRPTARRITRAKPASPTPPPSLSDEERYGRQCTLYHNASQVRKLFKTYFLVTFTKEPTLKLTTEDIRDLFINNKDLLVSLSSSLGLFL
jgi:hypothetical protein